MKKARRNERVYSEEWKNDTDFLHYTFYSEGYEQRYAAGQINNTYYTKDHYRPYICNSPKEGRY